MRRREFITLLGGAGVTRPRALFAQTSTKRPLIGWLGGATPETGAPSVKAFLQGMQERGYVEARDFDMAYRFAYGDLARYPALAKELVELKPDVILAISAPSAKQATDTIPIVSATIPADAVRLGLVASVPRPGGNVTGILVSIDGLPGKQVELARELIPGSARIGMLLNASYASQQTAQWQDVERAGRDLNVKVVPLAIRMPEDLDAAFQTVVRERAEALVVLQDGMLFSERRRIAALAAAARLPAVYGFREHVEEGGLISYGIDLRQSHRRAAAYVVKILTGTKPADLPVEFPTKLELVINLKTVKALGLDVPSSLLARADEVIE
jgi:putative ABC transport system substrate-binding protein